MTKPINYDPSKFTIKELRELIGGMYQRRDPGMPITIYTGLGGMMTFDYIMAEQSGIIKPYMTKRHGRLIRMLGMGSHKAVDENGIVWMYGLVKGKGIYWSNMRQRAKAARTPYMRFRNWEETFEHLQVGRGEWAQAQALKHAAKKMAKIVGSRRPGMLTPEEGAMRRGY